MQKDHLLQEDSNKLLKEDGWAILLESTWGYEPLKILINGTDRTESIPFETISIRDTLGQQTNSASFVVEDGGGMGLAELQKVIISSVNDETRYFAGYIQSKGEHSRGPLKDYSITCVDFSWDMEHPEALVDGAYAGKSDQWLIQNAVATCIPDIDCTTYVEEVLADTVNLEFDQETPRSVVDKLAKLAGAERYVDYGPGPGSQNAYLHYFDASTNTAPFSVSDSPDFLASFPYAKLLETTEAPQANKVIVIGEAAITATRTRGAEGDYKRWLITVLKDRNITTTAQAEERGDALLLELAASPSYTLITRQWGLRSGQDLTLVNAARSIDAAFEIKSVTTKITGGGSAEFHIAMGKHVPSLAELVARPLRDEPHKAPLEHEHGGGADGPNVPAENIDPEPYGPENTHTHSFADTAEGTSAAEAAHTHSFADTAEGTSAAGTSHSHGVVISVTDTTIAFAATTPGTITDSNNQLAVFTTGDIIIVSGSVSNDGVYNVSTGGVAGTIRTTEATLFEAAGATVTISVTGITGTSAAEAAHTHSFADTAEGTSAAGSSHTHSFSASVTGSSAAEAAHTHSFADTASGTSAAGSVHYHDVGFSVINTSGAEASHTHSFSSSVTGTSAAGSGHLHTVTVTGTTDVASNHTHTFTSDGGNTGSESSHTHAVGTFAVSGTSGAGTSHTHSAGTYSISARTANESAHTHAAGSIAVSGTSGAGSSHTHGVGTFAVGGTSGGEAAHTHAAGSIAVSGTSGAGSSHTHGVGTFAIGGTTAAEATHTHTAGTIAVSGTSGAGSSHTHTAGTIAVSGTTGAT